MDSESKLTSKHFRLGIRLQKKSEYIHLKKRVTDTSRPQWPRGLRRSAAALGCWNCGFEFQRGHDCLLWVLSGRGLCKELINRPENSYRLWRVVMCDLETSWIRTPWPTGGSCARNKQKRYRVITRIRNWKQDTRNALAWFPWWRVSLFSDIIRSAFIILTQIKY
jgi:hypothetical protein